MIEKILDLKNQNVQVDKLKTMTLEELRIMREEIRLISNRTPEFMMAGGTIKNSWGELENKVTGFDALWASINIAIAKDGKENFDAIYEDKVWWQFIMKYLSKTLDTLKKKLRINCSDSGRKVKIT